MSRDRAWRSLTDLAATQHGSFTRKQAAKRGIDSRRIATALRQGRIQPLGSTVFVLGGLPVRPEQRLMAASLVGGIASHRAAANRHRLDGFERLDHLDVSFSRGRIRRIDRVIVHTWRYDSRHDITTVESVRCTSIARTLVQLGAVVSRDEVEVALDSALRRGAPLAWIEETLDRLRRPGLTGANVLHSILDDPGRVTGLESPLERQLLRCLADAGLPIPVPQFEVVTTKGRFRADFAYPEAELLIEAHSMKFHGGTPIEDRDMRRHLALVAAGFEVVYVTADMVRDPSSWLPGVIATYRRRLVS